MNERCDFKEMALEMNLAHPMVLSATMLAFWSEQGKGKEMV